MIVMTRCIMLDSETPFSRLLMLLLPPPPLLLLLFLNFSFYWMPCAGIAISLMDKHCSRLCRAGVAL